MRCIALGFPLHFLFPKTQTRATDGVLETFGFRESGIGHDIVSYRALVVGEHPVSSCHSQVLLALDP